MTLVCGESKPRKPGNQNKQGHQENHGGNSKRENKDTKQTEFFLSFCLLFFPSFLLSFFLFLFPSSSLVLFLSFFLSFFLSVLRESFVWIFNVFKVFHFVWGLPCFLGLAPQHIRSVSRMGFLFSMFLFFVFLVFLVSLVWIRQKQI